MLQVWLGRAARSYALVTVLLFCVWLAPAQNRANFPWWNSPVVNDLGLSADQTQRIRKIVHQNRSRLLDARNTQNKAEGDLEDFLNDSEMNSKDAQAIIGRIAAARAETTRVFLDMSFQLREVLTLDQWRKLVQRWDEMKGKIRGADTQTSP